ncbi:hypothetical protein G9274_002106 [Stenotrophomonas rhizophila]|nr:hypothetical protein G9274_002106 [Stenotrophomonas rhizophila]
MRLRTPLLPALACVALLAACKGPPTDPATPAPLPAAGAATPSAPAATPLVHLAEIDAATLQALGVSAPLKTVHFRDRDGEGLLVLDRIDSQAPDADSGEAMDVALLTATLYRRADTATPFVERWRSEHRTECPGLDLEAAYFLDNAEATDLDGDGVAELTLPSHAFCGGGVDPHQIVIELRRGDDRYRVEGESLVVIDGEAPFGGERADSPSYAAAPAAFRQHLDTVWRAVHTLPGRESDGGP